MSNKFISNSHLWIKWVTVYDTKKEWPNVGILALTHWNEKVWLTVFNKFYKYYFQEDKILTWKVYLVCVNIKAYKKKVRFIDENMNRIWDKSLTGSVEWQRARELLPLLNHLDIVIDLHSVPVWNATIWISDLSTMNFDEELYDVNTILYDDMAKTWALIAHIIKNWWKWFAIECGNHNDTSAFSVWLNSVLNILWYYWVIKYYNHKYSWLYWKYKFLEEIIPETNNFKYQKKYCNFEKIEKWEVYATDNEKIYKNNYGKDVYVWIIHDKINPPDGCGFLFEKL